jgi:tRNA(Ile2) C34 agmatinyltransferase TiaS
MSNGPGVYELYKEHFACFKCRKMFKQTAWRGLEESLRLQFKDYQDFIHNYQAPCPQCGQPMPNMGKGFRPPQQKEVKEWLQLEEKAKQGIKFYGFRW